MDRIDAPSFALGALRRVRYGILLAEAALVALSVGGHLAPLPLGPIAVTCGLLLVADRVQAWWVSGRAERVETAVGAHLAVDLVALVALVAGSPDAHQPMQAFFVVEAAVVATVLPPRAAGMVAIGAAVLQTLALVGAGAVRRDPELPHFASHALLISFALLATTGFVARLAEALRERTRALREAERVQLATERLAGLGTVAAGVAHELATPLSTIGVLGDEAALAEASPSEREAARVALHGELRRCRDVLQRLKTGPDDLDGCTDDLGEQVPRWVAAWHRAHAPELPAPQVQAAQALPSVRGAPGPWRAALWTVLGNAQRAGATRIVVRLHPEGPAGSPHVALAVDDDGHGVSEEVARRAGEPFFTAWPSGGGQGLGLFSARTYARAVGGDLELQPRPDGGTCTTLRLPVGA